MTLFDKQVANEVSRMTHGIKAYIIRPDRPFIYNSRIISPDYLDMRRFAMHVPEREMLVQYFLKVLDYIGVDFDIIAGHESADIPFQSIVADRLRKSALVVRKEAKGHGLGEKLMGATPDEIKGKNVVHIGDLLTKGKAAFNVAIEVRHCGGFANYHVVGFNRLQDGEEALAALNPGVEVFSLCDKNEDFYNAGLEADAISKEDFRAVQEYGKGKESQTKWAEKFLRANPEFFEQELSQPGAIVNGEIKMPDAFEVVTIGYRHLWNEFYDTIRDALEKLEVKDSVFDFDYPEKAPKGHRYPDGSKSDRK